MSASFAAPALPRIPSFHSPPKSHGVDCIIDTRFRAAARLLQCLWLKDNNIATGLHVRPAAETGTDHPPLESLLSREAAHAGRNFLTPAIHTFVRHELIMREEGAYYDEERLFWQRSQLDAAWCSICSRL